MSIKCDKGLGSVADRVELTSVVIAVCLKVDVEFDGRVLYGRSAGVLTLSV